MATLGEEWATMLRVKREKEEYEAETARRVKDSELGALAIKALRDRVVEAMEKGETELWALPNLLSTADVTTDLETLAKYSKEGQLQEGHFSGKAKHLFVWCHHNGLSVSIQDRTLSVRSQGYAMIVRPTETKATP